MSDVIVLFDVSVGDHQATGKTRHYRKGKLLSTPSTLQIVRFTGDTGVYLLYLDADGNEQTDTWHENVAEAMGQAEWEFNVAPSEWNVRNNVL